MWCEPEETAAFAKKGSGESVRGKAREIAKSRAEGRNPPRKKKKKKLWSEGRAGWPWGSLGTSSGSLASDNEPDSRPLFPDEGGSILGVGQAPPFPKGVKSINLKRLQPPSRAFRSGVFGSRY